jgi:di/tricarboxylate transporter
MEKAKNVRTFVIKMVIWAALQAVIWCLPPVGALTEIGMHTLAVFVGVLYTLCIMPENYAIGMLMAPGLMAFSGGYSSMNASMMAAFGNDSFVMIFSISLLSGIIVVTGLAKTLALKMINAKFTAGRPWLLTFVILATGAILSLFIHPLVIIAILGNLIVEIYRGLHLKYSRWTLFVLCDMAIVCIQAQNVFPFQVGPSLMYGLLSAYDPALSLSNYSVPNMVFQFVFLVLLFAFGMILTVIFCRNCVDELKSYKPSNEKYPLSPDMKRAIGVLAVYVAIQLIPLALPAGSVKTFLQQPAVTGWSCVACVASMCMFKEDGSRFVTFENIMGNMNWYILFMLVGLGAVLTPMTSESSGIIQWLSDILAPLCTSVGAYGAFAILVIFCFVVSNFTDNIAVAFVVIPIIYIIGNTVGLNPAFLNSACLVSLQLAIILPAASPHVALVFAKQETGYVKFGPMVGWMVVRGLLGLVSFLTIGWALRGLF